MTASTLAGQGLPERLCPECFPRVFTRSENEGVVGRGVGVAGRRRRSGREMVVGCCAEERVLLCLSFCFVILENYVAALYYIVCLLCAVYMLLLANLHSTCTAV